MLDRQSLCPVKYDSYMHLTNIHDSLFHRL